MDTALKQRLVGASVLIALAVVVLPMLLGGRPEGDTRQSQKIELPPQPPELDFETRRYPIGVQPQPSQPDRAQTSARPLPTPGSTPRLAENSVPDETPVKAVAPPVDEVSEEPPAAASPPEPAPAETGRYVVQVASFGALDNATRLAGTLRGYGYPVLLDTVESDVGTLHRVRVGPYGSETEASGVVSRLQTQVGDIKPRIMDLQPEKAAQVTRPADPLVRWVVQVGSFSSADNADKLVARLRLESMTAFKEEISSTGSTIYRVRVGPFLDREDAIRADQQVMERMSIDGVVMSAD